MPKDFELEKHYPVDESLPDNRPKIVKHGTGQKAKGPIESPLFSMKEAAEYLGISLRVLRKLVEEKAFRVIPLAGVIKIRRATLDAWLEQSEVYRDDEEAFASKRFSRSNEQEES